MRALTAWQYSAVLTAIRATEIDNELRQILAYRYANPQTKDEVKKANDHVKSLQSEYGRLMMIEQDKSGKDKIGSAEFWSISSKGGFATKKKK